MQRGPLLQPLRSTELVLSGPPRAHPSGCVQPFRLRRAPPAPARALARRRASKASTVSLVPLHRRSKPTLCLPRSELRSAAVGRVFLSAFSPKKPHSFPRGKPRFAPLPPSANTPHPFSPKLSRFRAGSFVAAQTAPAPCFNQSLVVGGVTSPARGSLVLANLRQRLRPFKKGAKCRTGGNPARAPLPINSRSLPAVPLDRRLRKLPLRGLAVPAPLRGTVFQPSENCCFVFFTNALQLCEADVFRVLELALRFLPTSGT